MLTTPVVGALPRNSLPSTYATAATAKVATITNATMLTSLATSNRPRDTGRISR